MMISFDYLVEKHKLDIKGVLHLGASTGQERNAYDTYCKGWVIWVEAIPKVYLDLQQNIKSYPQQTAYNACSGGSYKNSFVNICNLKAVLKQGVRCLDFEIYSVNNQPVVATSTSDDYYVKETFNSVNFGSVMDTINNYAFAGGTCPNPTDPLIIHLRIKSNNQEIYSKLANIFKLSSKFIFG